MQVADVGPPGPSSASMNHTAVARASAADAKGRHRMLAELKLLEQETQSLEEELEELERTQNVSAVLQGLLNIVERMPDPLLSETVGPANPSWDQWFERNQDLHGHSRCLIL